MGLDSELCSVNLSKYPTAMRLLYDGSRSDCSEEIAYWRKAWPLHNYIADNFSISTNDNCRPIILDQLNIQQTLDELFAVESDYTAGISADCPLALDYDENGYWTVHELHKAIDAFKTALELVQSGYLIYWFSSY